MRKEKLLSLLGMGLTICLVKPHLLYANPTFGGGSGTENDPYRLSTPEHLTELQVAVDGGNNFSGKYFILTDDIDFTGYDNDNNPDNGNFNPIGKFTVGYHFGGHLDGQGHKILNLQIHLPNESGIGLFAYVLNGEITDLNLESVVFQGLNVVGGLTGHLESSLVNQLSVSGEVLGNASVGGLLGHGLGSTVGNSQTTIVVTGTGAEIGGLAGRINDSMIEQSSASGDVSGIENFGGLRGDAYDSIIKESLASGEVSGGDYVGGLVGGAMNSTIEQSFSTGNILGERGVGGLIGWAAQPLAIVDCYSLSDVTGDSIVGGLVGAINDYYSSNEVAIIKNSYYDGVINGTQTIGKLIGQLGWREKYNGVWYVWYDGSVSMENVYVNQERNSNYPLIGDTTHGTIEKENIVELTTTQMSQANSKNYMTALDFETIWTTTSTTPMFRWQTDLVSASQGQIQVNGNVEPLIADVTIPSVSPDLVIDPNSPDGAISPEFEIQNESNSPIRLELKVFEQTTNSFNDVLPDKYDSWEVLNKKESKYIALGLVAKEGEGWQRLTNSTSYVANHTEHEIGVMKPMSQVNFEFEVHHGRAFSESKTIQYKMVFVFDLLN